MRLLLAEYPTSGLGTATSLARRAGVSDPTVVRLVMKLGFEGFGDFQARLLAEVEARLHSPLLMMETKRAHDTPENSILSYFSSVNVAIEKTAGSTPLQTYDKAARLLLDAKGDVLMLGGRFSQHLAGMFAGYVVQFRPSVRHIGALNAQAFDMITDIGRRDVLVVFDYRRYQLDIISFARQAAARGARVLLFTDQWMSPIEEHAELSIVSQLEVESPFDTLTPALAQIEALSARMLTMLGDEARSRIELLEEVRHANAVTLDNAGQEGGARKTTHGPK